MVAPRRTFPLFAAIGLVVACAEPDYRTPVTGGDPALGRLWLAQLECDGCHAVPGVRGPATFVGPPLKAYGRRVYIAGKFPNTPENLVRWIRDPPSLAPRTAMPAVDLSEQQARDIAAYLYSLE
jgi:cytochrome c1